jgi:hypothetical protein
VICTLTLVAFAGKLTVPGTVATAVLLELRATVKPLGGAGPERLKVRFCTAPVPIVRVLGEKPTLPVTVTGWLAGRNPKAEALRLATPTFTPVTCGCVAGVVCPAAMVTLAGDTVTFAGSLLANVTVTPLEEAGEGSVTGNATERPRPTVTLDGRLMGAELTTVTPAVLSGAPAALAWMVTAPGATPVTGTLTLVANAAKLTLAGTVATVVSLELR